MLVALLVACTPDPSDPNPSDPTTLLTTPPTSTDPEVDDVRIDGAANTGDPDSFGVQLCATDDNVYVLFMDDRRNPDSGHTDLWLTHSPDGSPGSWLEAPVRVNHASSAVWKPHLACNDAGVYVVWEDDRDGDLEMHQIYFNRSIDGGNTFLTKDVLLEEDPDGRTMSLGPRLAVDGSDLFVVWYDNRNGAYDIYGNGSSDGGQSWRSPIRIDGDQPGSSYSARPQVALGDGAADIWVVWEDSRDGRADLYFARSVNGGATFLNDVRLDTGDAPGAGDSFEVRLCTDSVMNVTAVWHDARNGDDRRDIYFNHSSDAGSTWLTEAERLDTSNSDRSLFPVCANTGRDTHVAWADGDEVLYRVLSSGVATSDPVVLGPGSLPLIDAHGGEVVVAWPHPDGSAWLWDAVSGVEEGAEWLTGPVTDLTVVARRGEVLAAWLDERNGTSDVYFGRIDL